jgi:hypothetical protein
MSAICSKINWLKRLILALLDAAMSKLCVQIDLLVYIISRFLFLFTYIYIYIDFDIILSYKYIDFDILFLYTC